MHPDGLGLCARKQQESQNGLGWKPPIPLTFRVICGSRFTLGLALLHAGGLQGLHAVAGRLPGVSQALDGPSLLAEATLCRTLGETAQQGAAAATTAFITQGERPRPGLRRCKGCWMPPSLSSPAGGPSWVLWPHFPKSCFKPPGWSFHPALNPFPGLLHLTVTQQQGQLSVSPHCQVGLWQLAQCSHCAAPHPAPSCCPTHQVLLAGKSLMCTRI